MNRAFLVFLVAFLAVGCASSRGYLNVEVDTWLEHPELRAVHLAGTSRPAGLVVLREVSVTYIHQVEWLSAKISALDCKKAAVGAMGELLLRSEAMGGDSVYRVQSRGTRKWLDHLVCNENFSWSTTDYVVKLRGVAAIED